MLIAAGYFDKSGNPCLKVTVSGVFDQTGREIEAIIDTGFTGFLSIPLLQAFPIGLPLFGTTTVTLADGSTINRLTALGTLGLGGKKASGIILLEQDSTEALIGMSFLREFKLSMVITIDKIMLMDKEMQDKLAAAVVPAPPAAPLEQVNLLPEPPVEPAGG